MRGSEAKRPGSAGWERNLKRLLKAPSRRWLFTAPPVFRPFLREELRALGCRGILPHGAGATVEARPRELYPVLMQVRCAGRLFLLVDDFRAGAAEELFRKASQLPWELLLPDKPELSVRVTLRRCRIEHEGAAEHTLRTAIGQRLAEAGAAAAAPEGAGGNPQMVELFGEDNRMELRLDASGEQLYRRGYRRLVGEAPIRETTAASLLFWYIRERGMFSVLYDPMCGSGTFPVEAWAMARRVPLSAGRNYALFSWPLFSEAAWRWEAERLSAAAGAEPGFAFYGSDIDPSMVPAAAGNAAAAAGAGESGPSADPAFPRFFAADFFRTAPSDLPPADLAGQGGRRLLVINPPYGVRIKTDSAVFSRILEWKKKAWKEWDLLLIVPRETVLESPFAALRFENGGIPLTALIYRPRTPSGQ